MWSRLRNHRDEPKEIEQRFLELVFCVTSVILAINGLMVIGLHPVAATLILLIFGYVAWSLMKKLPRA